MATTSRRKTTPRTAPTAVPEGVLRLDRAENEAVIAAMVADREPLFAIGEVVYTIPRKVPPSWALHAYNLATTVGETAALAYAAEKLLDADAWSALQGCETLTPDDMAVILNALVDKVLPDGGFAPKAPATGGTNG